jgi:hypothetical protein
MSAAEIGNILEVQRAILEANRLGDWRRQWLVVSEVRHVEHLTVLVARSRQASFRVRARGALAEPLDVLLDEDARFELSTDDVFSVQGARNATPLYGLRRLKGLLDPELRAISRAGEGDRRDVLAAAGDEPFFTERDTSP